MALRLRKHYRRRAIAVAVLCLAGAVGAYAGVIHFSHLPGVWRVPQRWTEARAGWLYRSGQIPPSDVADVLRAERIDVVLDLTDDTPDHVRDAERVAAEKLGIRYLHLPVVQPKRTVIENLSTAVVEMELARRRGERVLVHCTFGHRRSATALVLYARLIEREPKHVAFAEFTRFTDPDSTWSDDVIRFLEKNEDAIRARVDEKLAAGA